MPGYWGMIGPQKRVAGITVSIADSDTIITVLASLSLSPDSISFKLAQVSSCMRASCLSRFKNSFQSSM